MCTLHCVGSLLLIVVENVSSMLGSYTHLRVHMRVVSHAVTRGGNSIKVRCHPNFRLSPSIHYSVNFCSGVLEQNTVWYNRGPSASICGGGLLGYSFLEVKSIACVPGSAISCIQEDCSFSLLLGRSQGWPS
jgi:hypothetical protein